MPSVKLKRAIVSGKVSVHNPHSGQATVYLMDNDHNQFYLHIGPKETQELAPKHCSLKMIKYSRNLETLLNQGLLRIV
jgi:hypothetical protein